MSESSTESTTTSASIPGQITHATGANPPAPAAKPESEPAEGGDDWKARAREWEKRAAADAKARERAERERDELKQQHMSAAEKELDKARKAAAADGEKAATAKFGKRLVAAEMRAALAGRHDNPDDLIDLVDGTRFLSEDGEPDRDAIKAWVDKVAPARQAFTAAAQGVRTQAQANDMNTVIRRAAGYG